MPTAQNKRSLRQHLWSWHWVMAACFLILFAIGFYMTDLPREVPYRLPLYNVHKSFGILAFGFLWVRVLLLLRVLLNTVRSRTHRRGLKWIQTTVLHTVLYSFMLVVPLSGYIYSSTAGSEIPFFGINLPRLFAENEARVDFARNTHIWLAYTFLMLISLHIIVQRKFLQRFSS